MSRFSDSKGLKCDICNWSHSDPESSITNSSGFYDDETSKERSVRVKGPNGLYRGVDGRTICRHCQTEERQNAREYEFIDRSILTDAGFTDSVWMTTTEVKEKLPVALGKRLAKHRTGEYLDEIHGKIVLVKTYAATHPKLKNNFTEEEKERWREEYSKSLGPKSTVPSLSDGRSG